MRYNDFTIPPLTQTLKDLEKESKDSTILIATDQTRIIGSIRAFEKDETCYIGRVIVHPDFRNNGIGKQLMIDIELLSKDVNRFELFTGYRDEKNLYFYKKLGYSPFKQVKHNDDFVMVYLEKLN